MTFFEGFELDQVDVGEVSLRVRHGGEGPPLVLLHGHPRIHSGHHMAEEAPDEVAGARLGFFGTTGDR